MNDKRLLMRWRGPAYSQEQQVRDQLTLSCCWKQGNLSSRSSGQTGSSHVLGYLKMIFFQRCRGCTAGSRRANRLNPVAQTTAASVITRQEQCNPLLHRPRAPFASGASPLELRVAPWTFREARDGPMSTETSSHWKSSWQIFNLCNWFPTNVFPKHSCKFQENSAHSVEVPSTPQITELQSLQLHRQHSVLQGSTAHS